ncbi:hypothetical protein Tco_0830432 [Tanacetum coccineum]
MLEESSSSKRLTKLSKCSRTMSYSNSISQRVPKKAQTETIASISGSNINSNHAILMEKFEALAIKIDVEFMKITGELKEVRNDCRNDDGHHALDYYMKDDMPMCDPMEANYYLEKKLQRTKSLPHTTKPKSRREVMEGVRKPPSIRNENDKGDVEAIEEDETKPILTMPNPNLILTSSPTVSPFLKDYTAHISYA